jgi:hypothetical protein
MSPEQIEEREFERSQCEHEWPSVPGWGIFIGLTRCSKCDTVARTEDFDPRDQTPRPQASAEGE